MKLWSRLKQWLGFGQRPLMRAAAVPVAARGRRRPPVTLVVLIDGTLSTLIEGRETHIGRMLRLLRGQKGSLRQIYYKAGLQWHGLRRLPDVAMGRGMNRQIRAAYGWLASRYRPGDRVFLFGYSRGGFAVRSLAGIIDRVGLLRAEQATERNVREAYRHYRHPPPEPVRAGMAGLCHERVPIEMIGVFDTVKALGLRLPLLWLFGDGQNGFHDTRLGPSVLRGRQALAMDETRSVFEPVLWQTEAGETRVEQRWFRGAHGDVGGQLGGDARARPLANIPLVWMLEEAERAGLALPEGWREALPCDPQAPSVGTWRGFGGLFILRAPRLIGRDASESIDPSALGGRRGRALIRWRGAAQRQAAARLAARAPPEGQATCSSRG